ncbi:MAG: cytochrome b/b6 domain-containing protein [Deferribacteres bacterium]|nr:cytochrome b/b6 domain-containing protein [candidate division KSB1 bacterium]MCB9511835.1 cytochrome b/b6 domain-containing protein [Deferribacteres bacterium]
MKKVFIYRSFERFWHWAQAVLIFFLMLSGFEIHGTVSFFGFENAVKYHNVAAWAFMILIVFAVFWHFTTGEWKQYVPSFQNLKAQLDFYLFGIFRNAPHPTKKTVLSKLNPLQRLTYLGLKVLVIPIMVISGILYMLYRYPQKDGIIALNVDGLELIAILHTIGALMLVAFVVVHVYLMTTGHTALSNLQAMLTGYEELEDDETVAKKTNTVTSI